MEQTRAETEMKYLIDAHDGRIGSPVVTVERLQLWAEELSDLRRRIGAVLRQAKQIEDTRE